MTNQSSFSNWDFDSIWQINENGESYPYLAWQSSVEAGNIPQRQFDFANGEFIGQATISGEEITTVIATNLSEASNVTFQYCTVSNHPSVRLFPNPANLGALYSFHFADSNTLNQILSIQIQIPYYPNQIWFRLNDSEWLVIPNDRINPLLEEPEFTFRIEDFYQLFSHFREESNTILEIASDKGGLDTLPVELSSFTALQIRNRGVELHWVTETETNFLGYNVYRSEEYDLYIAEKINFAIIVGNNSSVQSIYRFLDESVTPLIEYYYWLEALNLDLTNEFFGPIRVYVDDYEDNGEVLVPPLHTELIGAFPNPFNPETKISFSLDAPKKISLEIYNIKGQLVKSLLDQSSLQKGKHYILWEGKDRYGREQKSGIYVIRLRADNEVMIGKMLMLK
jgi:hypothetical protein